MPDLTDAKRRIVEALKRTDALTALSLAEQFETTTTAVRQHLDALEMAGIVERFDVAAQGRGRPAIHWRTTSLASELFPDRHSELTVELIESICSTLGPEALDRVIDDRARRQLVLYRSAIPQGSMAVRVRALAERRTAEGYLAEVTTDGDDLVLIEHHCPIFSAAAACQGLCRSELQLFGDALGPSVTVTREQHLLSGDNRCAYRITPTASA